MFTRGNIPVKVLHIIASSNSQWFVMYDFRMVYAYLGWPSPYVRDARRPCCTIRMQIDTKQFVGQQLIEFNRQ